MLQHIREDESRRESAYGHHIGGILKHQGNQVSFESPREDESRRESAYGRVLDLSRRGHTVADIVTSVKLTLEAGFVPNVDFIFGLPDETQAELESSLKLADQLSEMGARIHGHTFMPLPGTPYRHAPPGKINAATKQKLMRFVARGKLYGQWTQQIEIARDLAQIGRSRRRANAKRLPSV